MTFHNNENENLKKRKKKVGASSNMVSFACQWLLMEPHLCGGSSDMTGVGAGMADVDHCLRKCGARHPAVCGPAIYTAIMCSFIYYY